MHSPQDEVNSSTPIHEAAFGHRAILTAAAVGFGIGVILTLAISPLISTLSHNKTAGNKILPTPIPLSRSHVLATTTQLASNALGKVAQTGGPRLESVTLTPDSQINLSQPSEPVAYDAAITYRMESNAAGGPSQVGGAKADCFLLLRSLYTHNLPLNRIQLIGTWQFSKHGNSTVVMRAGSDPLIESHFAPWQSAARSQYKGLWHALKPHWIANSFQSYPPTQ
jgi:hypothetical protein